MGDRINPRQVGRAWPGKTGPEGCGLSKSDGLDNSRVRRVRPTEHTPATLPEPYSIRGGRGHAYRARHGRPGATACYDLAGVVG